MIDAEIVWDAEDDPGGNVQHIAANGLTMDEVEDVFNDARNATVPSRSSG